MLQKEEEKKSLMPMLQLKRWEKCLRKQNYATYAAVDNDGYEVMVVGKSLSEIRIMEYFDIKYVLIRVVSISIHIVLVELSNLIGDVPSL